MTMVFSFFTSSTAFAQVSTAIPLIQVSNGSHIHRYRILIAFVHMPSIEVDARTLILFKISVGPSSFCFFLIACWAERPHNFEPRSSVGLQKRSASQAQGA